MNNLVALTSNKPDFRSIIVNGRPVKSINQYYNKRKAELQKKPGRKGTTKRMECMTNKRNRRIQLAGSELNVDSTMHLMDGSLTPTLTVLVISYEK